MICYLFLLLEIHFVFFKTFCWARRSFAQYSLNGVQCTCYPVHALCFEMYYVGIVLSAFTDAISLWLFIVICCLIRYFTNFGDWFFYLFGAIKIVSLVRSDIFLNLTLRLWWFCFIFSFFSGFFVFISLCFVSSLSFWVFYFGSFFILHSKNLSLFESGFCPVEFNIVLSFVIWPVLSIICLILVTPLGAYGWNKNSQAYPVFDSSRNVFLDHKKSSIRHYIWNAKHTYKIKTYIGHLLYWKNNRLDHFVLL